MKRLLVIAALAAWAAPSMAQDLGRHGDWTAHQFTEKGKRLCLMWSKPKKSEGKYKRRGEVLALVIHRPGDQEFGIVSFEMGYPFASGKELSVSVDGGQAVRIPAAGGGRPEEDESAMSHSSPEVNRRLVSLMRAGAEMVARGESKRGTKTVDAWSLRGFTAAWKAISRACGAP